MKRKNMKKTYLLYVLAVVLSGVAFSSCNKVAKVLATATDVSWSTDVTINVDPQSDTTVSASVGNGSFTYNLDSLLKNKTSNAMGLSNIDTFRITACSVTIQNPNADNNFANFESASLNFSTNYNTTNTNMGGITNNPNSYAETLTLPVNSSVNLKTYIAPLGSTTFMYSLTGKLRKATTASLTLNVHLDYDIHVTP